jgi:NTE family protein
MSVPFFFEPFQKEINKEDDSVKYAWKYWMNTKQKDINPVGIFIDGGSISNFPIDLFHADEVFIPECRFSVYSSPVILPCFPKKEKQVRKS